MKIPFYKYQGTGNDFVMIDQRQHTYVKIDDQKTIEKLCDRRFGIGGDGLILIVNDSETDFRMVYFNADGRQSSMCGNGGRCIVKFAHDLGVVGNSCTFNAIDGLHSAKIDENGQVHLHMLDVNVVSKDGDAYVMNTGSPHYVIFNVEHPLSIREAGASIRYNETYAKEGININFCTVGEDKINVATYERGVEDETYSCGTGVVASAIAYGINAGLSGDVKVEVITKGGHLEVAYHNEGFHFTDIQLIGPAQKVFSGEIEI
jgi:diaminopimelate epimerase